MSENVNISKINSSSIGYISENEAINIANKFLKYSQSRRTLLSTPECNYVLRHKSTRSSCNSDTLAYIINYPEDSGFAIVASTNRVYPILAFSNEGNFSLENEIAKYNFITRLETFMNESSSDIQYEVSEHDLDGCFEAPPAISISLHQRAPWNKYVQEEHPHCLVGCVAVATALVMSYSKYSITYHNSTFHLKSIITAINKHQFPERQNLQRRIVGGGEPNLPEYSYEQALDSMARLLYLIGKDVNMQYGETGSGAYSTDAYELCKQLNFNIPSGYAIYQKNKVAQYLSDNHIVYVSGIKLNGYGGHAWVCDGCYYCVNYADKSILPETLYFHCDWGWGGSGNGYFRGDVYEVLNSEFEPNEFFAVKRVWK